MTRIVTGTLNKIVSLVRPTVLSREYFENTLRKISDDKKLFSHTQNQLRRELMNKYWDRHDEVAFWLAKIAKSQEADDLNYRIQAIYAFRDINIYKVSSSDEVDYLIDLANDKLPAIRAEVLYTLKSKNNDDRVVVPLLVKGLDDPDKIVQNASVNSLGERKYYGNHEALGKALKALKSSNSSSSYETKKAIEKIVLQITTVATYALKEITTSYCSPVSHAKLRQSLIKTFSEHYGEDVTKEVLSDIANGSSEIDNSTALQARYALKEIAGSAEAFDGMLKAFEKPKRSWI